MKPGTIMTPFSYFSKYRCVKMKLVGIIILFLGLSITSYLLIEKRKSYDEQKVTFVKQQWNITFQYIVVHFDLKGAPPFLGYLQSTLKTLKDRGATALLIEYEDMFPYEGKLVNLSATNHYDRNELKQFLMSAHHIGLEVIPLVPTLGHLEFALKLKEFHHLRENPKFPDSICPSKRESQDFLREMLRQVIKFHRKVAPLKHIHIGCNEVHQIKVCELCSKKHSSKTSIILEHIKFINEVIGDLSPKTTILLWDDMLRHMHVSESKNLKFPNIESVTWDYSTDMRLDFLRPVFDRYKRTFGNLWVATAYKGADGSTNTIPILRKRFLNHVNWLNFIMFYDGFNKTYNFKGIILTGRSRYSHMEPSCELLPVAMPSLVLNLILIEKYHNGIAFFESPKMIKTEQQFETEQQSFIDYFIADDLNSALMCQMCIVEGLLETFSAMTCTFEGSDLHVVLARFAEVKYSYKKSVFLTDDTNYTLQSSSLDDMKLGYVKMGDVKDIMNANIFIMQQLVVLESQIVSSMSPFFDNYIVLEYVGLKTYEMKKHVNDYLQFLSDYYVVKDWPRRYT